MGGIPTNYHSEVIIKNDKDENCVVKGLMAIGESACVSVHGANRLGSNSLLDLIVFGRAAAHRATDVIKNNVDVQYNNTGLNDKTVEEILESFNNIRGTNGSHTTAFIRKKMQHIMQDHFAVFRTESTPCRRM